MPADPRRVRQVFDAVIELEPSARRSAVETECGGDTDLRSEVLSLLEHLDDSPSDAGVHPEAPTRAPAPHSGGMFAIRELLSGESDEPRRFMNNQVVADYQVLGYIGGGGMAEVYKARHRVSHRTVALKVMSERIDSPAARQRFELEARTLGHLRHPHIAQVLSVEKYHTPPSEDTGDRGGGEPGADGPGAHSQPDTLPVIVMDYVENGLPITEFAEKRSLTTRDRVELFALVCDAMIHAHQRGVIHRDLKPANVLVDRDRQPKVIDFGISRLTQAETPSGQAPDPQYLGTMAYASPEHLAGEPSRIDTRSDVLCLGLILYELVARRRAYDFPKGGPDEAHSVIEQAVPEVPSALRPDDPACDAGLDAIVRFCVAKDPANRYQSVLDLRRDLQSWLDGVPLASARKPGAAGLGKGGGVPRAAAFVVGVVLLAAAIGLGAWAWSEHRARETAELRLEAAQQEAADARERDHDARRALALSQAEADSLNERFRAEAAGSAVLREVIEKFVVVMRGNAIDSPYSAAAEDFLRGWEARLGDLENDLAAAAEGMPKRSRALQWEMLGRAYDLASLDAKAVRAYNESLDAWQDGGDATGADVARVKRLLGDRLLTLGDTALAMNRFRDAIAYYRESGDQPAEHARSLLGLIACLLRAEASPPDEVASLVREADDLIAEHSLPPVLCNELGRVAVGLGVTTRCGDLAVPSAGDFAPGP